MSYGRKVMLSVGMEQAEEKLRNLLMENGFGVITEIDIKDKLQEKLGVSFREYKILGSCHPPSAFESLNIDLDVGMLLPCNFVIWDNNDGTSTIATLKASSLLSILNNDNLKKVGQEVDNLLENVMRSI